MLFVQLYGVLIESIGNLFQEQLIIIEEALKTDQYLQEVKWEQSVIILCYISFCLIARFY